MRRRHPVSFSAESRGSEPCIVVSDSFARRRRSFVLRSAFQKVSKPKKPLREDSTHTNSNSLSGKRRRSIQDVTEPVSGSHLKLQRFAPTQRLVDDRADFCLYLELQLSTKQALEDAHALVQVTARALRAAGCSVSVHMLQAPDSEVLAVSEEEAQAYALTIGSEVPDQSVTEKGEWAGRVAMQLAPWVTQHPDYTSHVLPLTGAAQCQRLCKLILTELRLELDVCCLHEGGHSTQANSTSAPVLLSAREKLLPQGMRAKTFTNVMLYPLHRDEARRQLTRRWGAQSALALPPLQDIYAYFGPRIAMYFAWLAFYTKMLVLPAVYGVVVHVLGQLNLAPSCTVHCVLVAIGTSLIADMWRRRQREVEFTWGYDGVLSSLHATTRVQFKGEWMQDPVTGVRCFDYPHHKRLLRQLLAVPLLVSMCCLVGGYVVGLHVFSERLRASYKGSCTQGPYVAENWVPSYDTVTCAFVSHGPSVINAVIIHVMDNLYQLLARKLTEFENYRTLDEHEAHLVAKRMPFHLVNSNASLWFLAFYVRRLDRVRERLWILLVATQLIDNFKEVGLPLAVSVGGQVLTAENKRRRQQGLESLQSEAVVGIQRQHSTLRAKRERVDVAKAATEQRLARVLMQKRQATYRDTFADYKELMVQFGYVTLYSPVFPLAAAFAWLNNTIESRSDLLKLVNRHGYQRPVAQHARGIGVWEKVLVSFAGVAVVVNCALVWTYELDELLPSWTELQRFAFIVACEHVIFVIKAWLNWAAPEVPVTSSLGKKAVLPPSVLETIVNGASLSAVNGQ
ncbi:Calcium-activated chloride channel [Phytophthora infestans]|uniref:Calcium-activated chloride channel n=1 Tax=Phytophthora infestans TaxID=4787 RepID=A0A8S9U5I5_PHYIN|nr:Calcium-activated chloride channel [Phytophthora infestans]